MNSAADDIEMRLIASGFVVGEWTANEIAQVIAPEVEAMRAQVQRVRAAIARHKRIYARLYEDEGVSVQVLLDALDGGDDE